MVFLFFTIAKALIEVALMCELGLLVLTVLLGIRPSLPAQARAAREQNLIYKIFKLLCSPAESICRVIRGVKGIRGIQGFKAIKRFTARGAVQANASLSHANEPKAAPRILMLLALWLISLGLKISSQSL